MTCFDCYKSIKFYIDWSSKRCEKNILFLNYIVNEHQQSKQPTQRLIIELIYHLQSNGLFCNFSWHIQHTHQPQRRHIKWLIYMFTISTMATTFVPYKGLSIISNNRAYYTLIIDFYKFIICFQNNNLIYNYKIKKLHVKVHKKVILLKNFIITKWMILILFLLKYTNDIYIKKQHLLSTFNLQSSI